MTTRSWRRDIVSGALLWIAFTGIEVLLVGKVDPQETPVGAVVAAAAAASALAGLRLANASYALRWSWAFLPFRLARNIVRDTVFVLGALLRRLTTGTLPDDRIEHIPFDAGGEDPESAARRALVIVAASLPPNSIVVDIDRVRGALVVHRLTPDPSPPLSRQWPL